MLQIFLLFFILNFFFVINHIYVFILILYIPQAKSSAEKTIPEEVEVVPQIKNSYPFHSSSKSYKASDLSFNKPASIPVPQLKTPDTPKLSFSYEPQNIPPFSLAKEKEVATSYKSQSHYEPITPIIRSKNPRLGLCKSTSILQTPKWDENIPSSNILKRNCSLTELTPKQNIKQDSPSEQMQEPAFKQPEVKKEAERVTLEEPTVEPQLPHANTISVNKRKYLKQKKIGEGGSSKVYSVSIYMFLFNTTLY